MCFYSQLFNENRFIFLNHGTSHHAFNEVSHCSSYLVYLWHFIKSSTWYKFKYHLLVSLFQFMDQIWYHPCYLWDTSLILSVFNDGWPEATWPHNQPNYVSAPIAVMCMDVCVWLYFIYTNIISQYCLLLDDPEWGYKPKRTGLIKLFYILQ